MQVVGQLLLRFRLGWSVRFVDSHSDIRRKLVHVNINFVLCELVLYMQYQVA